jgi:hypothetical protein
MYAWCCAHAQTYTPPKLAAIDTKKNTNKYSRTHTHTYTPSKLAAIDTKKHKQILKHTHTYTDPEKQFSLLLRHVEVIRTKVQWMRSKITVYVEHNLGFEVCPASPPPLAKQPYISPASS